MQFLFILVNIITFILGLGVIIAIHELGHFLIAKKVGILCYEYAIGMGPVLIQKRKGETNYSLRAIPIGGFVSMAGEDGDGSLLDIGKVVGLEIDSNNEVVKIALNGQKLAINGRILSFDLTGKDHVPLFMEVQDETKTVTKYSVSSKAVFVENKVNRFIHKGKIKERITSIAPHNRNFEYKKKWQRALVVFFGPLMNFILALFLYLVVGFALGKPTNSNIVGDVTKRTHAYDVLKKGDQIVGIKNDQEEFFEINDWSDLNSIGHGAKAVLTIRRDGVLLEKEVNLIVSVTMAGISNYKSNFGSGQDYVLYTKEAYIAQALSVTGNTKDLIQEGDQILELDGSLINNWSDVVQFFAKTAKKEISLKLLRNNQVITIDHYKLWSDSDLKVAGATRLATNFGIKPETEFDFGYAISSVFTNFGHDSTQIFLTIGALFNSSSSINISSLSGPVGIFSVFGRFLEGGILSILSFIAFLSVNIGIMNLLPIPALDGGKLLFIGIEAVSRKRVPKKVDVILNNIMFFLLIGLFIYVTLNDIIRLF